MAYNREWDRGKDTWDDNYGWSDNRGNVREREEDYYGDGKRRKFNNGVRGCFSHFLPRLSISRPTNTLIITTELVMTTPIIDNKIGTMGRMTVRGVAQLDLSRNVSYLPSQVPMSSSLVWTQTSQRPMSVDSHVLDSFFNRD